MWLVVGLGNPGPTYRHTRHNVGFGVADRLAAAARGRWRTAPDCVLCQVCLAGETVHLVKPHSFMNRSGQVVAPLAARHRIPAERTLLLHDDVDLPFGTLRLKAGGGHGGHNGLRSVIEETGSSDQLRVRMGIGRPADGDDGDVAKWVLSGFRPAELAVLDGLLSRADEATRAILTQGIARAASTFNARNHPSPSS